MKISFEVPKRTLDKKPKHGEPCNRCGLCCIATLCILAREVFGHRPGPCPALQYDDDGLSVCGLVADPAKYAMKHVLKAGGAVTAREAAILLIASGIGCDAILPGEPRDEKFDSELRERERVNFRRINAAKKTWGIR